MSIETQITLTGSPTRVRALLVLTCETRRWLFIIEGSITIGAALLSTLILPNYPATTRWLSDEEKAYAQWRLIDDAGEADHPDASTLVDGVRLALKDPKLYLFVFFQHISLLSQTFQYFFPTIVASLGYGNIETLLITVSRRLTSRSVAAFFVRLP